MTSKSLLTAANAVARGRVSCIGTDIDKRMQHSLELPACIEELIWDSVKADVRKRLKASSWQNVHSELKEKVVKRHCGRILISLDEVNRGDFSVSWISLFRSLLE
jgi:hypothetical protein